jgi:hypothetical protein
MQEKELPSEDSLAVLLGEHGDRIRKKRRHMQSSSGRRIRQTSMHTVGINTTGLMLLVSRAGDIRLSKGEYRISNDE